MRRTTRVCQMPQPDLTSLAIPRCPSGRSRVKSRKLVTKGLARPAAEGFRAMRFDAGSRDVTRHLDVPYRAVRAHTLLYTVAVRHRRRSSGNQCLQTSSRARSVRPAGRFRRMAKRNDWMRTWLQRQQILDELMPYAPLVTVAGWPGEPAVPEDPVQV